MSPSLNRAPHRPACTALAMVVLLSVVLPGVADNSASEVPAPTGEDAHQPAAEAPAHQLELAQKLHEQGEHKSALATDDELLAKEPDDAVGYLARSILLGKLGRREEAISDLRRVTELAPDAAVGWGQLGWQLLLQGGFAEAQQATAKAQSLDPASFAWTVNLGHTYLLQGDRETAHGWYARTVPLIKDADALKGGPVADFDLFIARGWQVETAKAERQWVAENFERIELAQRLNEAGMAAYRDGDYDKAINGFEQALAIRKTALPAGHPKIASSLNNLALLLKATGRYDEAEALYREALAIRKTALPAGHPDIANGLNNLAVLLATTGRYDEAESLYREALAIDKSALPVGHQNIATDINNLAELLWTTGRYDEAEPLYREALAIYKAALPAGHPEIAAILNNLAALLRTTSRYGEAEPLYQASLQIAQGSGEPQSLWTVQGNLAALYAARNQRPLAIFFGKQAVNTLQSVRRNLSTAEQATQQAFLKAKEGYYKDLADRLIAEGRLPEAQQVMGLLKEQELFEFLRRDEKDDPRSPASYNPFEAEQLAAYAEESGRLMAIAAEKRELDALDPFDLTPEQEARLAEITAELNAAVARFKQTLERIETAFAALSQERREELAKKQLLDGIDDRGLVRGLGTQGKTGVALLHTLVMEDRVHLLLTLPETLLARQAPLGEAALNAQVQRLRTALQDPGQDPRPAARALYEALIAPVAADLEAAGVETLMVSLDGTLRYVPLAALHDGTGYLVERYALSVFTDAARTNIQVAPTPAWRGVGLGVSLPHAEVGPTRAQFKALPAVPRELEAIFRRSAEDDRDGVLPGRYFLDAAFTADTLRKALRSPVLHIASHFSLQPGNESQSFLLLGDGESLELRQIREGNFDFGDVELLTLSACETAIGGGNAKGQEVEGLGALVQIQGAKGVIATLWPVEDDSTGRFMQALYRQRVEGNLSKAEALRQAQLAFLCGETGGESSELDRPQPGARRPVSLAAATSEELPAFATDPKRPYAHPYFWAPFILMGNWL